MENRPLPLGKLILTPFRLLRYLTPNTFLKKARLSRKLYYYTVLGLMIIVGIGTFLFQSFFADQVSAAWFNEDWLYRKKIPITAHTSAESNVYINLTGAAAVNTADTTNRHQTDCGDLRFIDAQGNILPYYIVSGCGTATTVIHVFFESFPAGAQDIYYYYGNFTAQNGFSATDFSPEASNYTIGTFDSEERGIGPDHYWKFDDGAGNVATSAASIKREMGLYNNPSWRSEDLCYVGKCLSFDGTDDFGQVNTPLLSTVDFSYSAWVNLVDNTDEMIFMVSNGGTGGTGNEFYAYVNASSQLDVTLDGISYITTTTTIPKNTWTHIAVTREGSTIKAYINGVQDPITGTFGTALGYSTCPLMIGVDVDTGCTGGLGNYLKGKIDEVKVYHFALSAAQVKANFLARGSSQGSGVVLGAKDISFLSKGLVGYWKGDETGADSCTGGTNDSCDSSGNGFDGPWTGNVAAGTGKYGNAMVFDGANDAVQVAHNAALEPTEELTYAAWFKFDTLNGADVIMAKNNENAGSFRTKRIHISSLTSVGFMVFNGSTFTYDGTVPTLVAGTWYHMAATVKDNQFVRLYFNGKLVGDHKVTQDLLLTDNQNFVIGAVRNGASLIQDWDGAVDEARVYNRALSSSEIEVLYEYAPGPSGYWDFETKQGTSISDKSGNGNTATLSNGPEFKPGKYGTAVDFDGSDDVATVTNATAVDMNTSSGGNTFSTWVYADSDGEGDVGEIYNKGTNTYLRVDTQSGTSLDVQASLDLATTDATVNVSSGVQIGTWNHIAVTYDDDSDDEISLYINGVLRGTSTNGVGSLAAESNDLLLGGSTGANFDGKIDEFRFYNYARSAKQITEDMNASHPAGGSPVGSAIGHWKFDEGNGTVSNNSGNQGSVLNGTLTSMDSPATYGSGWSNNGKFNKALTFDGSNDYVSVADHASLDMTSTMSVSAWVKWDGQADSSLHRIVIKNNTAKDYILWIYGSSDATNPGKFGFGINDIDAANETVLSNSGATVGQWYHIVGTYDNSLGGQNLKLYVNGVLQNDIENNTSAITTGTGVLGIGGPSVFFDGQIDEVKLYNYALAPSEVKIDYNRGSSLRFGALGTDIDGKTASDSASRMYCPPGDTSSNCAPIAEWNFEEGQSTTTSDTTGNNNTVTLSNTTWTRGKVGKGLSFNGSSSTGNTSSTLNLSSTSVITVEFWLYKASFNNSDSVLMETSTNFNTNNGAFLINPDNSSPSNKITVGIKNTSYNTAEFDRPSASGWHHFVIVLDRGAAGASEITPYIDGKLVAFSKAFSVDSTGNFGNFTLYLGARGGSSFFANQILDQVKIYNYALNPAQVAWNFDRGKPLVHYKMDECQGSTIYDSTGNGVIGTISLSTTGTQTTSIGMGTCTTSAVTPRYNGRVGKFNSSLNFDGTSDGVDLASSSLLTGTGSHTISLWAKYSSLPSNAKCMFSKDNDGGTGGWGMEICLNTDGTILGAVVRTTPSTLQVNASTTVVPSLNTWHHFVVVWESGIAVRTYIDGILQATTADTGSVMRTSNQGSTIGYKKAAATSFFDGQIDEVQIFNYNLSPAQIRNLYNQSSAVRFGPVTGAP